MKLQLIVQGQANVIYVKDDINLDQVNIIKAGIKKLIQSGRKAIVVDLTEIPEKFLRPPTLYKEILALQTSQTQPHDQVVIASKIPELGLAQTRVEALQILASPAARFQALEVKLKARIKELGAQKTELEKKLSSSESGGNNPKSLLRENSDLKAKISFFEELLPLLLKLRGDPVENPLFETKMDLLKKTLLNALQANGTITTTESHAKK